MLDSKKDEELEKNGQRDEIAEFEYSNGHADRTESEYGSDNGTESKYGNKDTDPTENEYGNKESAGTGSGYSGKESAEREKKKGSALGVLLLILLSGLAFGIGIFLMDALKGKNGDSSNDTTDEFTGEMVSDVMMLPADSEIIPEPEVSSEQETSSKEKTTEKETTTEDKKNSKTGSEEETTYKKVYIGVDSIDPTTNVEDESQTGEYGEEYDVLPGENPNYGYDMSPEMENNPDIYSAPY